MKIDILSLFPEMFTGPLNESIVGKAVEKGLLNISVTDFRDYTTNKQHHVDDTPYGGGAGMLLQRFRNVKTDSEGLFCLILPEKNLTKRWQKNCPKNSI